ncbi:MAG: efflux RND transporter periplasmic adaptor subunit [Candidatus Omnitrophica bacterium]|nr:efflux RND transporter periplasmic adaptor subunit [Candidatus Omnitrophota bacterium]
MFKSNNKKIYLVIFVVGAIFLVVFLKTRGGKSTAEVTREINPVYGSIKLIISTTGIVQPQNRLEIKPPISGRIEKVLVKEGQKVQVGEVLVWMSSTERAALLDAARSQSEEMLKDWQQVYKPTPLMSSINGEVIVRAVEPGQTVTSSDAVVVLSDRLIVKAEVDETDIGKIKIGQPATISLDAYPEVKVKAVVDHISYESKVVNNVTIYEVDTLPESVPDFFRSGMSADVEIITQAKDNVLLIPLEAVKRDKQQSFVLTRGPKERKAQKRTVEFGISDDKNIEIISGLTAQDKVLIQVQKYQLSSNNTNSKSSPFMPGRRR